MMRPRWNKVFSDLIDNKLRTILVVLSIAVGVLSVGVIAGAYVIISEDMGISYASNNPANIEIRMDEFEDDLLTTIRNMREVEWAEGRNVFNVRVRTLNSNQWVTIDFFAFEDFEENQINLLDPVEGAFTPQKNEIMLEKKALEDLDVQIGEEVEFQLPDGTTKIMPVVGIVQDAGTGAGDFLAAPIGYIHKDTLPTFQQPKVYNRIYATVTGDQNDLDNIRSVAANIKDKVEKNNYAVFQMFYSKTFEHPLAPTINAVLGILLALGVLIVFLSSSLIANTLSALLNQHLRHIGVMKLVGGRRQQILGMYLILILCFSLLALLIAIPIGGQGAYSLANFIASEMKFSLLGYRFVPISLITQIAIALLVPLVAGLVPVLKGSRITVLAAISGEQSEGDPNRVSRIEYLQMQANNTLTRRGLHIPRPFLISMRNTFRRTGRLILTLFTLTMGGAIFIAVFNVRVTLHDYIEDIGKYFLADVNLDFDKPYRLRETEQMAMQVEGVTSIEGWLFMVSEYLDEEGEVIDNMTILAPPGNSQLVSPILVSGRWIQADDVRKLAVSEAILNEFPDLQPGDLLPMKVYGKIERWEVVGIFKFIGMEGVFGYAPYEYVSQELNLVNRAYTYRVVTERHDREYQTMMAETVDQFFRDQGFKVRQAQPGLAMMDAASESLDILVTFLLIMALLTAIVGSMGLMGTMGMNVLERTREIGIMRSIGAGDRMVMLTVVIEGMVIGLISWVLGAIVAFPISVLLSNILSVTIFQTPIDLVFTPFGFIIWLGLVLILSALASILPARNAARLTIHEVLAYE
jgi:putative ABC transport system permease protein